MLKEHIERYNIEHQFVDNTLETSLDLVWKVCVMKAFLTTLEPRLKSLDQRLRHYQ